jgi:enterochelin esterase family protein
MLRVMHTGRTVADDGGVLFRLPDPGPDVTGVCLWLDLEHAVEPAPMDRVDNGWQLAIARPAVQRLEYLYALRYADGSEAMVCDPTNPRRVPTSVGDHSVIEFPGYAAPRWLDVDVAPGRTTALVVRALDLRRPMPVTIWTPDGCHAGAAMPLLVLHDGPEYERLASITRFSAAMIASGRLPAHRVALLGPGDRDRWYAASPAYARALRRLALPAIRNAVSVDSAVVLGGASLGALAALHAAVTEPGTADSLFLQSGSFFRPDLDAQERPFTGFDAVTGFVAALESGTPGRSMPVGMTCGLAEENLANNRRTAATLERLGHQVSYAEVADAHTYVGWRDALDPHLVELLARVWAHPTGPSSSSTSVAAGR